mmetsp:Transcript_82711/g.161230  ORF Transcript_82711/g.161230 Transcript_82711/m.161230 type:complete len:619 (-) Transcript_82711:507-2363(-)
MVQTLGTSKSGGRPSRVRRLARRAAGHRSQLNPAVSSFIPSAMIHATADLAPDRDNNAKAIIALDAYLRHLEHGMVARLQALETTVPSSQQAEQPEPQQKSSPPQPSVPSTVVARLQALEDIVFSPPHPQPPSPPTVTTGLQQLCGWMLKMVSAANFTFPCTARRTRGGSKPASTPPTASSNTSPQETGTAITSASPAVTTPAVTVTIPPVSQQDSHTEADEAPAPTESEAATLTNHASPGQPSLPHKRLNLTLHSRGGGEGESDAGRERLAAVTMPAEPDHGGAASEQQGPSAGTRRTTHLRASGECADTEDSNGGIFLEFLLEFGGWHDADFDPALGHLLSPWHLSCAIKVQTFWRGLLAKVQLSDLRWLDPIKDTKAVDAMTGPYTPTQFHPRELREENVPLDFYDKSWEIRGSNHSGGRRRALTKRDHADGYVRVGDPEFPGPEFQAWKKSIVNDLHPVLGQLNSCYQPGLVPLCIFPMVVDHPAGFFDIESINGFSSVWRESLAQVANLAATYGIFRVFQPQDIARVRAFLDFWGGRSAHRVRRLYAISNKHGAGMGPLNNHVCLSDPITDGWRGNKKGEHGDGYRGISGMPSWFIAILNTLAAAVNKDAPLA